MNFSDLLNIHGLEPHDVRLARHAGAKGEIYRLWRNNPDGFDTYCRTQQRGKFGKQNYVAHFVATPGGETLFTGLHHLQGFEEIGPGFMHPVTGDDIYETESPRPVLYSATGVQAFDQYIGKLIIDWGASARQWCQIANNKGKPILEIRREYVEPEFPGFAKFNCSSTEVSTLPESWKSVLAANKGVYVLVHKETQKQYIGSATGENGFLGRWLAYEANGHGGNTQLKRLSVPEFDIGILEVCASSDTAADIINREQDWKCKLGSRAFGLNSN